MNKVHRIVWSESRKAFIVASEKAKAKGKPSSTRKAIASAMVMALAMMAASPIMAASSCPGTTISISGTEILQCVLATGDVLTVTNTGSINTGSSAVAVHNASPTSITNNGTITGNTGVSIANSSTVTGGITNSGTITGGSQGIHVTSYSTVGGITNNTGGTISGGNTGINLSFYSAVNGGITNSGLISGGSAGIGLYSGSNVGGITNSGTISGGTYSIYVSSGSSVGSITNLADGRLSGNLYVGDAAATVSNAGTIDLKTASGYIAGNYTQTSTGVLQIGASSNSNYGKLTVGGTATIAGSAYVNVASINTLAAGQTLSGVVSAGTLSGNFSSVGDDSALFNFTSVVNGNNIDLNITSASTSGVLAAVNANGNSAGVGAATVFDALIAQGGGAPAAMAPVITALGQLSTQQAVSNAVSQALPLINASMSSVTSNILHSTDRVIQARQEANKGLSSGDDFLGDREFWVKPVGSWARQGDLHGVSGYDANTYGLILGVDKAVSSTLRIGGALSSMHSNVDSNSSVAPQNAKVDGYRFIGYGSYSLDERTDLNFQGDYGFGNNKGRRTINFGGLNSVASSSYDSWNAHVGAGLGRVYDLSANTTFTPSVRADYTYMNDAAYTETGAGALNLNVAKNTTEEMILSVDGKLTQALSDHTTLTENLGAGYDTLSRQASITADFVGGGGQFTTNGLSPSPWLMRGGLGMVMTNSKAMTITVRYDVEGRQSFTNQTVSVKFRMPF